MIAARGHRVDGGGRARGFIPNTRCSLASIGNDAVVAIRRQTSYEPIR